jgi:SRSO17 transposase
MVLPRIERHGPIRAWIIDDTSFPKKGQHSVGVAHQYCGQLGKQTARSPSRCRSPMTRQACRWPIGCI